ncbi:MAG TPA: MBL fold metallo-hydrolase [Solirubrobacteraceae bacterium]|nr:MBL fold metallo-hydrolase [Solirubrobacteraceae bacterium]
MSGRLTYIGHATVLIEEAGVRLLTDPLLHAGIGHMRRRVPLPQLELLRDLDAVLISHPHADHLDVRSLRMLEHPGTVVAPRECAGLLRRAGMRKIVGLVPGERCDVGGIGVEAVRADHDGRRHPFGRELGAVGFLVDGPARVYFAGDTDLFDEMEALAGLVDVALLPIWGWGPRLPAGHLNPETAARAVAMIGPSIAVPIHWGTMRSVGAKGAADPHAPARAFADAVSAAAPATAVRILAPGDSMPLAG